MSPEALGLVLLSLMVVAIMIGFPTAFTLMSLGITFGFLGMGFLVFDLAVQRVFFVMQNDVLVAIPLFLFMGYVIERSEEHTSELQSRVDLVCRLLLEKK